ncbi:MAG TPA: hypothetical protein VG738_23395 [Chitinophagaceae bacterium]|nr:hypothetical protein [Chitinophagaceae bacterium]
MAKTIPVLLLLFFLAPAIKKTSAQNYHALDGSSFSGVNALYNNPASTVNQVYKWDVTVFGFQAAINNNAIVVNNNSLSIFDSSTIGLTNGLHPRHLQSSIDVNILNMRYRINPKNAVGIGFRLRSYNHLNMTAFAYDDTTSTLQSFLHQNNSVNFLDGDAIHSGWAEVDANYSRVIFKSSTSLLSAGITLSYLKCLSDAYARVSHLNYSELTLPNKNYYVINQAAATLEYSDNYLITNNNNSNTQNFHNFLSKAPSSAGFDIGAEYLIKNNAGDNTDDVSATNYDWKIGLAVMDIGHNKFNPIEGSVSVNSPLDFTDSTFQNKINKVRNIKDLRDSLSSLFGGADSLQKPFTISRPTRLVLSVDHSLGNHFFINGQLSINFFPARAGQKLHSHELNLLTVTPRWETRGWGIYLPVQYNAQKQFWIGAAVKLGPVLLGVHNLNLLKWFKTGQQTYNGGGYILLSVHPFNKPARKPGNADCPVF